MPVLPRSDGESIDIAQFRLNLYDYPQVNRPFPLQLFKCIPDIQASCNMVIAAFWRWHSVLHCF